jgi:hypothetical protein
MRLNYSPQSIRVFVGVLDFEITDFLDGFDLVAPDPDIGQRLTWTGSFSIAYNTKAITAGITEADLSPYTHPERWRPDVPMAIEFVAGTTITRIPLRIQNYSYLPMSGGTVGQGQGAFHTILDALAKDRPGEDAGFDVGGGGTPLGQAVQALLTLGYGVSPIVPSIGTLNLTGYLDDKISTRNPINDCADLTATCWQWLTVGAGETISTISGDPMTHPILFTRPLGAYEIEAETDGRGDWYSKAIVTGSYQHAVPPKTECDDREVDSLDDKGRPGAITTTTMATFAEVFPGKNFAGVNILGAPVTSYETLVLKEEKTILYQYGDTPYVQVGGSSSTMAGAIGVVTFAANPPNLIDIYNALPVIPIDPENQSAVMTVTISIQLAGAIYPQLGTNTARKVASIQIESERVKKTYKPFGTIREAAGADYKLVPSPIETIDETSASKPQVVAGRPKGSPPGTPNKCLEKTVKPEPRQTAPQWTMETVPVRGESLIVPQNWAPLIQLPKIQDFGFIPSQSHADSLAVQVAARCARESDPWRIVMPIAPEWIAAGCPLYFRCHLHDAHYEVVAPRIIHIQNQEGKTTLEFQANRIGPAPIVPNQPPALPFIPLYALGPAPPGGGPAPIVQPLQLTVSAGAIVGIAGDQIGPIIVQASGGNP